MRSAHFIGLPQDGAPSAAQGPENAAAFRVGAWLHSRIAKRLRRHQLGVILRRSIGSDGAKRIGEILAVAADRRSAAALRGPYPASWRSGGPDHSGAGALSRPPRRPQAVADGCGESRLLD